MSDQTKKCTKCSVYKQLSEFHKDKKQGSGLRPECKLCNKAVKKAWALKNPERKSHYLLKCIYGISGSDYNLLLEKQNYCCAICLKHMSLFRKRLHVDHDHITGKVRGLLCRGCNHGLGNFEDNVHILSSAITYLDKYKND